MRVVALSRGYYNHRLVEPGMIFNIRNDGDFSPQWMRPAKGEKAVPVAPKPPKSEQQLRDEELTRGVHYAKQQAKTDDKKQKVDEKEDLEEEGEEMDHSLEDEAAPKAGKSFESKPGKGSKSAI